MNKAERQKLKELTKVNLGDLCPYCKIGTMVKRKGKFGDFLACDQYPRCSFTQAIKEPEEEPVLPDKFWAK